MAIVPSKQSPIGGVDVDSDELRIRENRVPFKKNLTYSVKKNASAPSGQGSNYGVDTPMVGNKIMASSSIQFPSGVNTCIGSYESKETNELYVFVHNTVDNHFVYRINGVDGSVQMVYLKKHLRFKLDPKFFISEGRCVLRVVPYVDKETGLTKYRKLLIFTNNDTDIRCISTEDSIATSSFDETLFPYFIPKSVLSADDAREEYISLGVATPNDCIGITAVPRAPEDINLQNSLINKGWQWRIKTVDVFGRESEHGMISERWFAIIGGSCLANSSGFPRCVDLSIYAGNPFVDKIHIEFRNCTGNNKNLSNDSGWFLYEIIEKYNNCGSGLWYQRTINSDIPYDSATNRFTYRFCGNKLCNPVDPLETSRIQPQIPLKSSSLFALDKGIALANNLRGFEKLDCAELKKISFGVTTLAPDACAYQLRKIVIYAVVYNHLVNEVARTIKIASTDNAFFGVFDTFEAKVRGQYFPDGQPGFIGYLAGTQYSSVSRQVVLDPTTGAECNSGLWDQTGFGNGCLSAPGNYMQKFEFFVPPGRYVFRVAGSRSELSSDYQKTSTLTRGQVILNDLQNTVNAIREVVIDCCSGDVILNGGMDIALQIEDFSRKPGYTEDIETKEGYLYESEKSRVPIELNPLIIYHIPSSFDLRSTDHNGFWYFRSLSGSPISPNISEGYLTGTDCTDNFSIETTDGNNVKNILDTGVLHVFDVFIKVGNDVYPDSGRRLITGDIRFCQDHNIGIAGIPIVMQQSSPSVTALIGDFKLIAHNRYDLGKVININNWQDPIDDLSSYTDYIIYSQGGCQLTSCDDPCVYCIPIKALDYKPCGTPDRNTIYDVLYLNIRGVNIAGPQHGGRYGLGIMMWDWMGRVSFVQADDSFFVNIPTVFESHTFDYSKINFTINPSIVFPAWVKRISFCITDNLNWDDFLTWSVDRVDKVDAGGNINSAAPTKLRIYYESLLEYSKQNNYAVNAAWQFFTTSNNVEKTTTGDLVQFVKNGDNSFFNNNVQYQVRYDSIGKYFEVDYDPTLGEVLPGAIYKLIRPKTCLTNDLFYELCPSIGVVNGVPQVLSGEFKYTDSYMLLRIVPVPIYTENPDDAANPIKTVQVEQIPFYMEHPSPSDFWGDHCATRGRLNVKNPYERQQRNGSEIALSKSFINKSSFNGLSYFDLADVESFDEMKWGDITLVFPEVNTLLVICEHGNFLVGYNDTGVRTDENGALIAPSSSGKFGTPQRNGGTAYGLLQQDVATAQKRTGVVIFLDGSKADIIYHGYSDAKAISATAGFSSWMTDKVSYRDTANNSNSNPYIYHFISGVNPDTNEYMFTSRRFKKDHTVLDDVEYINDLKGISIAANETAIIDIDTSSFKCFASFTPEYYGTLERYFADRNMVAIRHGYAWHHNGENPLSVPYNNFFGVQCKKVFEIITNLGPEKEKAFLWTEVYCKEHLFEADRVVTEAGQLSRIKKEWWEKRSTFFTAAFLCDLNTPVDASLVKQTGVNALLDGDHLFGRWLKVMYVSRDEDDGKYCELSAVATYITAVEKSAD